MRASVLFLSEVEHSHARDQNYGRTRIADRGRVLQSMFVVVLRILRTVGLKRRLDEFLDLRRISGRVPLDEHWADLGADEVIRAARSQMRQFLRALGVHEVENLGSVRETRNPALLARHRTAQEWHHHGRDLRAILTRLGFGSTGRTL